MNRILIFLVLYFFSFCARSEDTPIFIDLNTNANATKYSVNDVRMTPPELQKWFKADIAKFGSSPIVIRPDEQTPFKTVFDLLQTLREAGLKQFEIRAESTVIDSKKIGGNKEKITELHRAVRLTPDNLKEWTEIGEVVVIPTK
jgi:hypothetical protein